MNTRSGYFTNNLSGKLSYNSFVPSKLPPSPHIELDSKMINLLIDANKKLSLLNGISTRIPNMDLFISMYIRKEALLSSQIEGTQATLDDILDPLVMANSDKNIVDVVNYIRATEFAIKRLNELPLCNRLIKETHAILMHGVRGQEKSPGEFRNSQNWIGGQGCTIKTARYVSPNVQDMINAMSDLEKYINSDDSVDPLIRVALIHYQFETIHPFLDGNGRIGRLLITLFLLQNNILSSPSLYISYFLKCNRIEYYDRMSEVRKSGNYEQWINFFLQALSEASDDAIKTIDKLTSLHNKNIKVISELPSRQQKSNLNLLYFLEQNPIIEIKKTAQTLNVSYNTVSRNVSVLIKNGILKQVEKKGKSRIYSYTEYLDILRKDI